MSRKIVIIGAGLTGLTLAYLLKKAGIDAEIVEARKRLGGRIYTVADNAVTPLEMGATWLGKKHVHLLALLEELKLDIYPQYLGNTAIYEPISTSPPQLVRLPPNDEPSYRIKGGSTALINALSEGLKEGNIHLGQVVESIQQKQDGSLDVVTATTTFTANQVVVTLPPYLWQSTITFQPVLSSDLFQIAQRTHTWMGESIKVGLRYAKPFWREENSSGTLFSSVGPIPEMYDHTDEANEKFALVGFMNGAYANTTTEHRLQLILQQLEKYYGPQVKDYLSYEESVWVQEPYTFAPYVSPLLPHQNNGHKLLRSNHWNDTLLLAGSETAPHYPGYMDGAVESAQLVFKNLH
jgi:monoamine oxidase